MCVCGSVRVSGCERECAGKWCVGAKHGAVRVGGGAGVGGWVPSGAGLPLRAFPASVKAVSVC